MRHRLYLITALLLVAAAPTNAAFADVLDSQVAEPCPPVLEAKKSHIGDSPEAPPPATDEVFTVDVGPGLDTGCTFRNGGPLVFAIEIDRYIGDLALLRDANPPLIDAHAHLKMPAWDVDYDANVPGYNPERDRVYFNGNLVNEEYLTGSNNVWKMNEFDIPIEWLNFPAEPGSVASNTIRIDIDTANPSNEAWCTSIDWAALEIKVARPVVFVHGILSSGSTWDGVWTSELAARGLPFDNSLNMGALDGISQNAAKISAKIAQLKTLWNVDRVNIVSHSKGGLDARHFVEHNDDVDKLFQIGTPNRGSPLADIAQGILVIGGGVQFAIDINALAGPAGYQLTQPYMIGYNLVHGRNRDVDYYSVAGVYDPDCFFLNPFCKPLERLWIDIIGEGDLVVPRSSVHSLSWVSNKLTFTTLHDDYDAAHINQTAARGIFDLLTAPVSSYNASTAIPAAGSGISRTATLVGSVAPGGSQTHTLLVDNDEGCLFSLMYGDGDLDLVLTSPSGAVYVKADADSDPELDWDDDAILGGRMEVAGLLTPETGIWTAEVLGTDVLDSAGANYALNVFLPESDLMFRADNPVKYVSNGNPIILRAHLNDTAGTPIGTTVTATIGRPDGINAQVQLHDDGMNGDGAPGDGVYGGEYTNANIAGAYRVLVVAEGTRGQSAIAFSREDFDIITVSASASDLRGAYSETTSDPNGNGYFDTLTISVGVDVTAAGIYRVSGILKDSAGNSHFGAYEAPLAVGSHSLALTYDGRDIFENHVDGPYYLEELWLAEVDGANTLPIASRQNAYQTAAFSFLDFEHGVIWPTGINVALGVDNDGNGLYDVLRVNIGTHFDYGGYYHWTARLEDANGLEIGFAGAAGDMSVGANDLRLDFGGELIGAHGVNGPFVVRDLFIYNSQHSTVISTVFSTPPFRASDFEGYQGGTPPVADAGPDQVLECTGPAGTLAVLDASGSYDDDGDPLTYTWILDGTVLAGPTTNVTTEVVLGLGANLVQLNVEDGTGESTADEVLIMVVDTTPPAVSVASSPTVLWPPNHKMVNVELSVVVTDLCDEDPIWQLVSVTSNEPDDGLGSGDTSPDVANVEPGTADTEISLRAERQGSAPGRVYEIVIRAFDASGNATLATAAVNVPHSMNENYNVISQSRAGSTEMIYLVRGRSLFRKGAPVEFSGGMDEHGGLRSITPRSAYLTNTAGSVAPREFFACDVDHDNIDDAVVTFDSAAIETLAAASTALDGAPALVLEITDRCFVVLKSTDLTPASLDLELILAKLRRGDSNAPVASRGSTAQIVTSIKGATPNPFNPNTTVIFELRDPGHVDLDVYDIGGRIIMRLVDGHLPSGPHAAEWGGVDARGTPVPAGVYFFRLKSGDVIDVKKGILLK